MALPVVHLITDRRLAPDLAGRADAALAGIAPGRVAVHLREKDLGGRDLLALARRLAAVCHARGQLLLVNDRADVALAAGADGVHLPSAGIPPADARRLLGPQALVGTSCHSEAEVVRARDGGASYATFGPIHETPSKLPFGPPVGVASLRAAARLGLPLVALGGMDAARAPEAVAAGASGVAVIRAWLEGPDPAGAVRALLAALP
ncbi:MAG TPA: thiamine phosphate synthase [Anaeromyxobacter sp.]